MSSPAHVTAVYAGGDRLELSVRGHRFWSDQPVEEGGANSAPTPTELFVASLAGCVAFYAERFLRRHGLSAEGLSVTCSYQWSAAAPLRVAGMAVHVDAPGLTEDRTDAFQRVVERCPVHNTLAQGPEVTFIIEPDAGRRGPEAPRAGAGRGAVPIGG